MTGIRKFPAPSIREKPNFRMPDNTGVKSANPGTHIAVFWFSCKLGPLRTQRVLIRAAMNKSK